LQESLFFRLFLFEFFDPFLSSSIDLFACEFMGLLSESFNAEIQRELPPLVAPRAMAYITKFAPTMSRIMINKPMAGWLNSKSQNPCCKAARFAHSAAR
jgi:hypothetical protein